ncbi:3-oxoacyl-(ACP) reductase [Brucella endophytica]|uniref:3-oxoacyl-(ACP) reductase n=1 Tax=Brucella endophytica TaxID=1963359 RepID=A0A916SFT4_9HYPH|nr:3-oxoacyl-(ACP) reductase [Brucella endophytica]
MAIVTGGARGIGFAIARKLSDDGAAVVIIDRDADALGSARMRIGADRPLLTAMADVSSAADMERVAAEALAAFGSIDVLCPNAAIFDSAPLDTMEEALWDRLMSVNLKGVFLAVKACLPAMKRQRYGRIVASSSITGNRTAIAGMAHYASTKAGINGFVRAAALELASFGISVNAVEPGHVMTEGAGPMYDAEFKAAVEAYIPLGRFASPADIAEAVTFLASERAGYITGQTLTVDGGLTLREYPAGYPKSTA